MSELLFINACVRGERSRTLRLARTFLRTWTAQSAANLITERDLCAERLQPQYPEVLAERDALWAAGRLEQPMFEHARQFAAAGKIVIAAPFWDLDFPAVLKIYLERISVADITFGYDERGAMIRAMARARAGDVLLWLLLFGAAYLYFFGVPKWVSLILLTLACVKLLLDWMFTVWYRRQY